MAGDLEDAWKSWLDAPSGDTDTNKALADALAALVSGAVDEPRAPAPESGEGGDVSGPRVAP